MINSNVTQPHTVDKRLCTSRWKAPPPISKEERGIGTTELSINDNPPILYVWQSYTSKRHLLAPACGAVYTDKIIQLTRSQCNK